MKRYAAVGRLVGDAGPRLVVLAAAVAIAAQLATLAWKLVPGARRAAPPPVASAPRPVADASGILGAHLFGAQSVTAGAGLDAPRTRVALVLAGTLAVSDPKAGLAIVGETAQAGKVYAVGAGLPGGVRLHEVYTDRVVLERDGVLETLPMPHQLTGAGRARLSAPGSGTEPALADSVQRLIAQGPEVVGEVLRPMPTYVNGQLKGFRVYPGRDRRRFARLGLRPGDVVTQINGVPLADAQRGMEILRTLGASGTATVSVERDGASQQLTVDAAQFAAATSGAGDAPPSPAPPADDPQNSE